MTNDSEDSISQDYTGNKPPMPPQNAFPTLPPPNLSLGPLLAPLVPFSLLPSSEVLLVRLLLWLALSPPHCPYAPSPLIRLTLSM